MKVGVLGLGVMGVLHARVYKELGVLESVFDIDPGKVDVVCKTHDVRGFTCIEEFINYSVLAGITAVSIAVPTPWHLDVASKCIQAGLDVLVEKPICNDIAEAELLIGVAQKYDKILAVGYIERFNPAVQKLKSLVDDGSFGEIISVNIRRVGGLPRSADNVVTDLMTHDFNLLLNLLQKFPDSVYVHRHRTQNIIDSAQVLLGFGDITASCESNWISPVKIRKIQVTGTKKCCEVNLISQEVVENMGVTQHIYNFNKEPLREELMTFVNACQSKDVSKIVSGEDALQTLKLTLKAAQEGIK